MYSTDTWLKTAFLPASFLILNIDGRLWWNECKQYLFYFCTI